MADQYLTDEAVLADVGRRLSHARLQANLTQAELARRAGVGRSTVERLEAGNSTQLANFIRILRVLELLDPVMQAVPEPGLSPMELLESQAGGRKRARSRAAAEKVPGRPWQWADEQ
jgi:transcriptional regulator with XRE-family HTH domain